MSEAGARVVADGDGLEELRDEITRLMGEVAALEELSRAPAPGPADRQRSYQRIVEVEARLVRLIERVRELNRQITLIEGWRRG